MRIAVIGPGAMGCLLAARLSQSGAKVTLVDHNPDRAARLSQSGLRVASGGQDLTVPLAATHAVPSGTELIVVCTKARATAGLVLPAETPVLTLQNGLGNAETLCSLVGSAWVLAGTTAEASEWLAEGQVRQTVSGVTRFGAWTSCDARPAVDAFTAAGFEVETTEAPGQAIWEKAAMSAGVEPLAALLGVTNGKLMAVAEVRQLLRDLVVEAVKVASLEGYRFPYSLVEGAEAYCEESANAVAPMLQDVRRNRPTEADALIGEIIRRAQAAGLPTPRLRMAQQLITGLEHR